ncbi:MAG: ferritin [Rhodobacterales bacterium]|nr:MAG: ferritin [Rhodobacterales bacterium]
MNLNKKVADALNQQINSELKASYEYLAMAAYFESVDLPGFAKWFRAHSVEETGHAMRIFDFVNRRGGRVELTAIEQPRVEYDSAEDVMQTALAMERVVTSQIHALFEIAMAEKEYGTQNMLQWFLEEQVEEEDLFSSTLAQVQAAEAKPWNLMMLDKQLGQRTE